MGAPLLDGVFVPSQEADISQRSETAEVGSANGLAGECEGGKGGGTAEGLVLFDKFADFVTAGMEKGVLDRGQLDGEQDRVAVMFDESSKRSGAGNGLGSASPEGWSQSSESIGGAKALLEECRVAGELALEI